MLIPIEPAAVDAPEDVVEPIEEIIQNNQGIEDIPQLAEEQVLAMDDDIDTDSEGFPQVQLLILPVEIVPFPDFNNLQPLIPEEIEEADLLGWINEAGNALEPPQQVNQNIRLGFVQLHDSWPQHPFFTPCSEAIRNWVKHFSHPPSPFPSVLIPDPSVNFFSFLLLQSPTFDWAMDFFQSNAWTRLTSDMGCNATLFSLPNSIPDVVLSHCPNFEQSSFVVLELLGEDQELSPQPKAPTDPVTPKNKRKGKGKAKLKAPLSEADVRRSLRLKKIHKGFKSSSCKDKNCLDCSSMPPTVSPKIIRNLGAAFCGIDPQDLSPSKLNAKPVQKKRKTVSKKKDGHTSGDNQASSSSGHGASSKSDDAISIADQSSKEGAVHSSSQRHRGSIFCLFIVYQCLTDHGLFLVGILGE